MQEENPCDYSYTNLSMTLRDYQETLTKFILTVKKTSATIKEVKRRIPALRRFPEVDMNSICSFLGYVTALSGLVGIAPIAVTSTCKMVEGVIAYQDSYSAQLVGNAALGVLRHMMSGVVDMTRITEWEKKLKLNWQRVPYKGPPAPIVRSIKFKQRGYFSSKQVPFLEDTDPATFTKCDWYNYVTYLESMELAMFVTEAYASDSFKKGRNNCNEPNVDPYFTWRVLCQEKRLREKRLNTDTESSRGACCAELTYKTSNDVRMLLHRCAQKYKIMTGDGESPQTLSDLKKNELLIEQGKLQGKPSDARMIEMPDAPGAFPYELPEPLNLSTIVGFLKDIIKQVEENLKKAVIEKLMKMADSLEQAGCGALVTAARRRQPLNWINNALIEMCLSPDKVKECYERRMCDKVAGLGSVSETPKHRCIKSCRADSDQASDKKYTSVSGPESDRRRRAQRLFSLAAEEDAAQRSKCSLQAGAVPALLMTNLSGKAIFKAVSFLDSAANRRYLRYLICAKNVDEVKRISVIKHYFRRLFGRVAHSPLPQGPSRSWGAMQWMQYLLFVHQRSRAIAVMTNGGILGVGQVSHSLQCTAALIKQSEKLNADKNIADKNIIDSETAFAICNKYLTHNPTKCVAFLLKKLAIITEAQEIQVYEIAKKKETISHQSMTPPQKSPPQNTLQQRYAAPVVNSPPQNTPQRSAASAVNYPPQNDAFFGGARTPVGYKTAKLMREGYPKKQAVAIALSMHQAGRLGQRGGTTRAARIK